MRYLGFCRRVVIVGLIAVAGGCSGYPQSSQVPPIAAADQRKPSARAQDRSVVSLWVSLPSTNRILGLSRSGKETIATIDTAANGCYGPTGIKVGHKQLLWAACSYNLPSCTYYYESDICDGEIQAYAPGSSSPSKTYSDVMFPKCKSIYQSCWYLARANDVAFDTKGHVFAANVTSTYCFYYQGIESCGYPEFWGGYTWWDASNAKAAHIKFFPNYYREYFYYLDVDASGNLFIDGAPDLGTGPFQVYEVTHPAGASPEIAAITPPTPDRLGGVYVSNAGTVLNVVDETARTISQYALPWVPSESPFNVLGPTVQEMGKGQPISGGFDRNDKRLALGDADGWVDLGNVTENKWTAAGKKKLASGAFGAAYVPSDK